MVGSYLSENRRRAPAPPAQRRQRDGQTAWDGGGQTVVLTRLPLVLLPPTLLANACRKACSLVLTSDVLLLLLVLLPSLLVDVLSLLTPSLSSRLAKLDSSWLIASSPLPLSVLPVLLVLDELDDDEDDDNCEIRQHFRQWTSKRQGVHHNTANAKARSGIVENGAELAHHIFPREPAYGLGLPVSRPKPWIFG